MLSFSFSPRAYVDLHVFFRELRKYDISAILQMTATADTKANYESNSGPIAK